jgi:hypothetical protein
MEAVGWPSLRFWFTASKLNGGLSPGNSIEERAHQIDLQNRVLAWYEKYPRRARMPRVISEWMVGHPGVMAKILSNEVIAELILARGTYRFREVTRHIENLS